MKISKHENEWFSINEIDQSRGGAALVAKHLVEGDGRAQPLFVCNPAEIRLRRRKRNSWHDKKDE